MNEPDFWRTEIWHPLVLHFPLAVLLLATVAKLIAAFTIQEPASFWQRAGSYLLYFGWVTAWLAVYTGNMADGVVARKICDPTVLKLHQIAAYNTAYLFTGATALDLLFYYGMFRKYTRFICVAVVVLMLVGSGYLVYSGHLGARVVYQQAGGVRVPSADCAEYN